MKEQKKGKKAGCLPGTSFLDIAVLSLLECPAILAGTVAALLQDGGAAAARGGGLRTITVPIDRDFDGKIDLRTTYEDLNRDGKYDRITMEFDDDGDGRSERSVTSQDTDVDGRFDRTVEEVDQDGDGNVERKVTTEDTSRNGVTELKITIEEDLDGDGRRESIIESKRKITTRGA